MKIKLNIFILILLLTNLNILLAQSCVLCQENTEQQVEFVNICSENCHCQYICEHCILRLYLDDKKCPSCSSDLIKKPCEITKNIYSMLERCDIETKLALTLSGIITPKTIWYNFLKKCIEKEIDLEKIITALKKANYDIEFVDYMGNSILHACVIIYNEEQNEIIMDFLLYLINLKIININEINKMEYTVLDLISIKNDETDDFEDVFQINLIEKLKDNGAKCSEEITFRENYEYDDLNPILKIMEYFID